jgi:hypothetical protein
VAEETPDEGPGTRGTSRPLDDLFDTFGKAVAAIAGLAAFVYVIGGLTVLARLQRLELPEESVIPEIPRERLALIGLAQLLWTLVLGGAIAAIALWLIPGRRPGESWGAWLRRLPQEEKRKWIPALALLAVIVLIAPWSINGLAYVAVLLVGMTWFIGHGRDRPLLALLVALLLAGTVTVLRELEFPGRFTRGEVTLTRDSASLFPEARRDERSPRLAELDEGSTISPRRTRTIERREDRVIDHRNARVIETTDDAVLIGFEGRRQGAHEEQAEVRLPPVLVVIPRESVARIRYIPREDPASHSNSVAQKVLGTSPPPLPLMCLIPSCEWDDTGDVESNEPAFSAPFVF